VIYISRITDVFALAPEMFFDMKSVYVRTYEVLS